MKMLGNARKPTEAEQKESTIHILNGLISYHERMTMGMYPERDFYLESLRYALKCVQERDIVYAYETNKPKEDNNHGQD